MPQLTQLGLVYQSQWFWLLLVLAVLYFGVGRWMLPKVEATVDRRDGQIASDLAAAERARANADATEEAWRTRMNDARGDAKAQMIAAKAQAARDAEARIAKADAALAEKMAAVEAALAASRASALTSIESVAADAARDIVGKVSGASVTTAQASQAVKAALSNG